ncbi:lambda-crystallin-like isoform X1 [Gigantopelta aegis]|uniref:lambda-crystallin-like isoform X1 n=1 Tax=Gigantopelta aegis TaxID=1735272 RepID=UPI001B8882FF|nr:lambda-crystallin-like isoform X1 [Gigantopelta aegis]
MSSLDVSRELKDEKIAIVGSGLIGQIWAMIFAGAGYRVSLFDIDPSQVKKALQGIKDTLAEYEHKGHLRGTLSAADQTDLVTGCCDLAQCMDGAKHVQECVPENLELKRKVFQQIDQHATSKMVLASSSSCILSSQFASDLKHKDRVLIAHPVNPPYFIPLVEIIPAEWTNPDVTRCTRDLMEQIGQSPVTLNKELPGFALNRIQYAIINECWNMVQSGVLSASDIDKLMYDGLGPRYAFIGPLETMHLNADGIVDYCKRYADGAYRVSSTFKPPPIQYDIPTAESVMKEMEKTIPVERLSDRRKWRDDRLAALAMLKKDIDKV